MVFRTNPMLDPKFKERPSALERQMRGFKDAYCITKRQIAEDSFVAVQLHYDKQVACKIVDLKPRLAQEKKRLFKAYENSATSAEGKQLRTEHKKKAPLGLWTMLDSKARRKVWDFTTGYEDEVRLLSQLNHPNIERVDMAYKSDNKLFIIHKLAAGETLASRLREYGSLSEEETAVLVAQIIKGLQHLHKRDITHAGLRPENIFFDVARGVPRLVLRGLEQAKSRYVTSVDKANDMWALGQVACVMLTGAEPFSASAADGQRDGMQLLRGSTEISDGAKDFVRSLLRISGRPTASQAAQHQWLQREPFRTEFETAYARIAPAYKKTSRPQPKVKPLVPFSVPKVSNEAESPDSPDQSGHS